MGAWGWGRGVGFKLQGEEKQRGGLEPEARTLLGSAEPGSRHLGTQVRRACRRGGAETPRNSGLPASKEGGEGEVRGAYRRGGRGRPRGTVGSLLARRGG